MTQKAKIVVHVPEKSADEVRHTIGTSGGGKDVKYLGFTPRYFT